MIDRSRGPVARWPAGLIVTVIIGFAAIVWTIAARNAGLYPVVLSDEYRYSMASRRIPFAVATVPSYLYLVVYRSTNLCGDAFLSCGRLLNLAFFAAAAPLIYRIARRVVSRPIGVVVAALAMVGPFSTFTAYFMPESMYWFGFWTTVWLVLSLEPAASLRRYAIVGGVLGVLSLVKPHAIFLLPPVMVFLGIEAWRAKEIRLRLAASQAAVLLAAAIAMKFAIGYAIAGRSALTLFGSFYSGIVSSARVPGTDFGVFGFLSDLVYNLSGHLMALSFLFALPFAKMLSSIVVVHPMSQRSSERDDQHRVLLFTVLTMTTLIVVTSIFTIAVNGQGPYETLARLHARYYDFAFPLLLIIGAMSDDARSPKIGKRVFIAAVIAATVASAGTSALQTFVIGLVDYPELQGVSARAAVKHLVAILGIVTMVLWVARPRYAVLCFLFVAMPFVMLKGSVLASEQLHERRTADVYDIAGRVTKNAMPRDGALNVTVFGSDPAGVYRTLFQLDSATAIAVVLDSGEPIRSRDWPGSSEWAIVVGNHRPDGLDADLVAHDGFALLHRHSFSR